MATHRARGAALPRFALLMSLLVAAHARSSGPASCDARSGHGAADVGDGGYALLQEGVAWNLTYELACGFEVEFVQWRPQQMWLDFFLVPGHRRDETDPATWRAASRADPEPIGVELLTRMLAGAPAHLDWAPP